MDSASSLGQTLWAQSNPNKTQNSLGFTGIIYHGLLKSQETYSDYVQDIYS